MHTKLEKWKGDAMPLGPIHSLSQKTKMPLGSNTTKMTKLGR
jgi:hypothetical protein